MTSLCFNKLPTHVSHVKSKGGSSFFIVLLCCTVIFYTTEIKNSDSQEIDTTWKNSCVQTLYPEAISGTHTLAWTHTVQIWPVITVCSPECLEIGNTTISDSHPHTSHLRSTHGPPWNPPTNPPTSLWEAINALFSFKSIRDKPQPSIMAY